MSGSVGLVEGSARLVCFRSARSARFRSAGCGLNRLRQGVSQFEVRLSLQLLEDRQGLSQACPALAAITVMPVPREPGDEDENRHDGLPIHRCSQLFTQNTAGVPGAAEAFDLFGAALAASGPQDPTASPTSPTGSASEARPRD